MKRTLHTILLTVAAGLLVSSSLFAQFNTTGTTTVSVTVATEAALSVTTGTTNLTNVGTIFNDYTGTTNFTYKLRTTRTGGTGTLTLRVTSDFTSVPNGPSVASPPTAGDTLSYSCTVVGGTACSGPVTASTASSTSVATWGADAHSAATGTTGNSVSWTLVNDPLYPTGSYNATVTFTISST